MLATVCRIGQYMIKKSGWYLVVKHGAKLVYGDTDSVMVQLYVPPDIVGDVKVFEYHKQQCFYKAKPCFFIENL